MATFTNYLVLGFLPGGYRESIQCWSTEDEASLSNYDNDDYSTSQRVWQSILPVQLRRLRIVVVHSFGTYLHSPIITQANLSIRPQKQLDGGYSDWAKRPHLKKGLLTLPGCRIKANSDMTGSVGMMTWAVLEEGELALLSLLAKGALREREYVPCGDDEVYVDIQQGKIDEFRAQQMAKGASSKGLSFTTREGFICVPQAP